MGMIDVRVEESSMKSRKMEDYINVCEDYADRYGRCPARRKKKSFNIFPKAANVDGRGKPTRSRSNDGMVYGWVLGEWKLW